MKGPTFIIHASVFLQLVYVVAGNDVITFNQGELDEDNIEAVLETENFIQVVDRRSNNHSKIAVKATNVYQNVSPDISSQVSIPKSNKNSIPAQNLLNPSSISFNNTSRTPSVGRTPSISWEDLSSMSKAGVDKDEEDLLEMDNLFANKDSPYNSLSRYRRAAVMSGDTYLKGQFNLNAVRRSRRASNLDKVAISRALTIYFEDYFQGERIQAEVVKDPVNTTVLFDIIYDDGTITVKDLARALNALDNADNFQVSGTVYAVSLVKLQSSLNAVLQAVICFLCSGYQQCKQGLNLEFLCFLSDNRLFPFGADQFDRTVPPDDEFATARINLDSPIPFDHDLVRTIYISVNGLISFGSPFSSYTPLKCPVFDSNHQRRRVIAVYWTDLEKARNDRGNVFYQVYTRNSRSTTSDYAMLSKASRDVVRYTRDYNFQATFVLVVTWSDMPAWPLKKKSGNERVSFQSVIISNGETSYVINLYAQGAMGLNPSLLRPVSVCLKDINLDYSWRNFYKFDRVIGNTGDVGKWIYKLGYVPNYQTKCYQWFEDNMLIRNEIQLWNRIIPACPCNEFAAWISFQWIPSYLEGNCYDSFPVFGQIGRRCCYRNGGFGFVNGFFENRIPLAGNLQLFTPYFGNLASHQLQDAAPKDWCCRYSNLCHLYYIARPVRSCEPRFTWRAWGFGDPHFSTLDKMSIIFNGLGEYRLLEVNTTLNNTAVDFQLQGRTCRAIGSNGTISNATVFCALALKNTNHTSVQVSLHPKENYMVIFVNEQDFSVRFRDNNDFNASLGGIFIKKLNGSLLVSTPDDIGITISHVGNLLDFTVEISVNYRNTTKGLLGNFNGDPSDDLIYPNGTTLPNTTSERRIFEYCQTWAVTKSIFAYAPGENSSTYSDPTFVPIFLDEANETDIAAARNVCGSNNLGCIYDYVATRDAKLALNTRDADNTLTNDEKIISNNPPVINVNGSNQLNVTVNQPSTLTITGSDQDNDTFYYFFVSLPSSGFTYSNTSDGLTVNYTPVSMDPASIEISARDALGLASEIPEINIVSCSGCSKHGSCNFSNIITTNNDYFFLATCDCDIGYSGDDCENDTDGCDNDPCPENTNCTDVPASEQKTTNIPYTCSNCSTGFQLIANDTKCDDIDECSSGSDPCGPNAYCYNTIGSYICECFPGFRKSSQNKCVDINECVENQHHCAQICNNTVPKYTCSSNAGSEITCNKTGDEYTCSCHDGFQLYNFGFNCIKQPDIDPCQNATNNNCSFGCINNSGEGECFCETGYRLAADGFSCEDIDECKENLCSQVCNNTMGSYTCSCYSGFTLSSDNLACDMCPDNTYGLNCSMDCNCRGQAIKCDQVQGCICMEGWTGNVCDEDINECEVLVNPCAKDKICGNTNGSFTCDCPDGYRDINGSCTNINECDDPSVHNCSQLCIDNPGSFACACRDGFNAVGNLCIDIDECQLGLSGCGDVCRNMEGSFNCECRPGFVLDYDRTLCVKDLNPCRDLNVSCEYGCELVKGLPQCFCKLGYALGTDNNSCIDINECTNGLHNCTGTCINKVGSYDCTCSDGKRLANDKRSCEACDDYHWGPNCENVCGCDPVGAEKCDPTAGCKCKIGWGSKNCSEDIDECSRNDSVCQGLSDCFNTIGSYLCKCKDGFKFDNKTCIDINECETKQPCDHMCNNTVGSYSCSCFEGFFAAGDKCIDINECAKPSLSKCDQQCRNTQGGFACECYEGYVLNTTTRNTCYRDPSATSCGRAAKCDHECVAQNGQEICFCRPGYELQANNSTCKDINECVKQPCVNGNCTNLNGSFSCACEDGLKLAVDERTCQACEFWYYGSNCNSSCACSMTNTETCVASNGTCVCKGGWTGTNCTDDIDECSSNNICGYNANCVNTPGSYKCVCNIGNFPTSDRDCIPCDDTDYGQDCLSNCSCVAANTEDCNNINGTCTCKPTWTGSNCEIDIDECKDNASYCGPLENCNNLNGSAAVCLCKNGYHRPNPSDKCEDIDECLDGTLNNCTSNTNCNNTEGGYTCFCKEGFKEFNNQCTDINECLNGTLHNCTGDTECINTEGGFTCSCKEGYTEFNNQCTEGRAFPIQVSLLYDDSQIKKFGDIFNNTSDDFKRMAELVESGFYTYGRRILPNTLLKIKITQFTKGSVVASLKIYIDENNTTNAPRDAATLIRQLYIDESIPIDGIVVPLNVTKVGNSTTRPEYCDIYIDLGGDCAAPDGTCKDTLQCSSDSGENRGNKDNLIIGLAVGIPLFIILTVAVALLALFYVRRKRQSQAQSSSQSVDHASQFRNVVATRASTKGSWGAPQPMYAPDNFSDTGTNDSGNGGLIRTRPKGRSNFEDSAWYDNRGATSSGIPESRETSTETGGPMSNFSWEYMFRLLEPHKDFEIQRPNYKRAPNPTFISKNSHSDSAA